MYPLLLMVILAPVTLAQTRTEVRLPSSDWRRIGGTTFEASLAELATGPMVEVWYNTGGDTLYARTARGKLFETNDFESWIPSEAERPGQLSSPAASSLPEAGALLRARGATLYALGRAVYRSEDGGRSWNDLTSFRGNSIIGDALTDLAVSPRDDQEIAVAGRFGLWRSADGGLTWSGLNQSLPNLPAYRLLGLPGNGRGVRILTEGVGALEWAPGEKSAWQPVEASEPAHEAELLQRAAAALETGISAAAAADGYIYAGHALSGRLSASSDNGASWRTFQMDEEAVITRIFPLPGNPRVALAAGADADGPLILRTTNGGIFWDDLSNGLTGVRANAVVADPATGSVYAATGGGVFFSVVDLRGAGAFTPWIRVSEGLPELPVNDIRLDNGANQLYVVLDGAGVFAGTAPHRFLAPSVVNSADLRARGASPGVLLSVLGSSVVAVGAGSLDVPVLAANLRESQIQVPFEVSGSALSLALTAAGPSGSTRQLTLGLPLYEADPAIFEDRDGAPMVLDADSGILLDAMTPARSGARIQILATGLGKVDPAWPTGMPAPLDDPPAVVAAVNIMLDGTAIEADRATLAPGYVGFYLIEFTVPTIVNEGPAELYIEAAGRASNRTRIYLEQ